VQRATPLSPATALDAKARAALRAFRSRRMHLCAGCGRVLLVREDYIRSEDGQLMHTRCASMATD